MENGEGRQVQKEMTPEDAERLVSAAAAELDRVLSGANSLVKEEAKRVIQRLVENYELGTFTASPPQNTDEA